MFQRQVNIQPAPAVAGDFASANPNASVLAGPGALVSGANGVTVGRFAWADFATGLVANTGAGAPSGFVHREQQAVITQFLQEATELVPEGIMITLHQAGDFWAKNDGASAATIGQKVYANSATGQITTGATGTPPTGASVTAALLGNIAATSTIAVNSYTGSIAGTTMTISAVGTGLVAVGNVISGTNILPGTTIVSQLTGSAGSTGTYEVSVSQTVSSTTITTPSNSTFRVVTLTSGGFAAGQTISGGTTAAGTTIVSQISGTAFGVGYYNVTISQTVASATITASGGYLDVTAVASGALAVNDVISGGTIVAGTYVTQQLSGAAGGIGGYLVSTGTASASGTVTVYAGVETKWVVASAGAAGELIKISTWPLG